MCTPPPHQAWSSPAEELAAFDAIRGGDEAAFRAMAELLQPVLVRLAGVHGHARDAVDDIVVRTWELALGGLDMFRWQTPLATWVAGITVSLARSRSPRGVRASERPLTRRGPTLEGPPDWSDLPWGARWDGVWPIARAALAALPAPQREVVHTRDVEAWPARRACDVLGITVAAQERLLDLGRAGVRDAIALQAGSPGRDDVPAQMAAVANLLGELCEPDDTAMDPRSIARFRRWQRVRGRRRSIAFLRR